MTVKTPGQEKRYCRLCCKKESRKQCAYGGKLWDKYSVKDATKSEQEDAAEESGISNGSNGDSNSNNSGSGGDSGNFTPSSVRYSIAPVTVNNTLCLLSLSLA